MYVNVGVFGIGFWYLVLVFGVFATLRLDPASALFLSTTSQLDCQEEALFECHLHS